MEIYQIVVTSCAGIITIITLLEKLGLTARVKKVDSDFNEMRETLSVIPTMDKQQRKFISMQDDQNMALLAILRNELYCSFKIHRDVGVWTDDECAVQTKLHHAYKALHGNGEEDLWWEKKKTWRIVSNEEYKEIMSQYCNPEERVIS